MKPSPISKNETNDFSLLPADKGQALKFLVMLSEKMVAFAERETQILIQNDMVSFAIMQDEKETLAVRYSRACAEFNARLEEFRNADQIQLTRLENLQRRLGDATRSNSEIVQQMFVRAQKKTKESLITVQELAQTKPVNGAAYHHTGAENTRGA